MPIPTFDDLFNPLLKALHQLGGSGSNSEIEDKVVEILNFTEKEASEIHRNNTTKLSYRLAWAKTYLKLYGLLERSKRGIWALTERGLEITKVNKEDVKKFVKKFGGKSSSTDKMKFISIGLKKPEQSWQDKLLAEISKISPDVFERLCQRVLREAGFTNVEVTGRPGDGGIDGKGRIKISGFLGFSVVFQCKRYSKNVSSKEVRDFRGAISGRTDRGLLLTNSGFTKDAKQEAIREGAIPIDLVGGEELVEKMKELGLGVKLETEEIVRIDEDWFESL